MTLKSDWEVKYKKLHRRFEIYAKAINKIDDFFEYRYRGCTAKQIRKFVMGVIDDITEQLKKTEQ